MKKFWVILACVLVLVAAIACGEQKPAEEAAQPVEEVQEAMEMDTTVVDTTMQMEEPAEDME